MDLETQTSESLTDIDLFDDETLTPEEPAEPTSDAGNQGEGNPTGTEQTEPQGNNAPAQPMLDIVYNGQAMQLTKEQAVQLAQKGMNYDKKLQEIEQLRNAPEKQLLQKLAMQSGMPYEQFLANFQNQIRQSTVQIRAEQLARSGMDMNTAMRLADTELQKEELQNVQRAQEQQRQQFRQQFEMRQLAQAQHKQQFMSEIADLMKENPDFQTKYPNFEAMPKVMQDAIVSGGSIKQAYQQVVIEELRNENAAYKQNQINREQSPGSASGGRANAKDVFEDALFGDD